MFEVLHTNREKKVDILMSKCLWLVSTLSRMIRLLVPFLYNQYDDELNANAGLVVLNYMLRQGLKDSSSRAFIGVKRLGDLDSKPFLAAAERKFSDEVAPEKAVKLCSAWDSHLRDPSWHPFKVIMDKGKAVVWTKFCISDYFSFTPFILKELPFF